MPARRPLAGLHPPRESDFTSRLRSPAVASRVGVWLGICFGLAFLTGLLSHLAQSPGSWLPWPAAPAWGYRVTQGLHVITGTAAVPLLLVKLWAVFPRLFAALPRASVRAVARHGLERASIGVLVAAAVFQLATGLANSAQWYPWAFSFRSTHYAVGWIAVGALAVHVGVKLPVIRAALGADVESSALDRPGTAIGGDGLSRRGLLRATWVAAGVAVLATAGATVPVLRRVSLLATRSGAGPQGLPVNKSAVAAGVTALAGDPAYVLTVVHAGRSRSLDLAGLRDLPQHTVSLPIACVEGWSAGATWTGVRVRDLMDLVDAPRGSTVAVRSLQPRGPYRATVLPGRFVDHPDTLLALRLGDEQLDLDHGFPCRLIAPDRPGVLQTKWVHRLEVLT